MRLKVLLAAVGIACSGAAAAAQVPVDFDSLTAPVALADQFTAQGVVFEIATVINQSFGGQVVIPSGTNYVAFGDGFTITFVDPTNPSVAAVTDSVSFANLGIHSGGQYDGFTVSARNLSGTELGSATVQPVNAGSEILPYDTSFAFAGIHSLVFARITNPTGAGIVGLDSLRFEAVTAVTAVPLPATLWLLAPAVAGLARRRRRVA